MRPELEPPELTSPQQALDVGYREGTERRENCVRVGVMAQPENLAAQRDIAYESPYRFERTQSLFYEQWRLGFDAGFLGSAKPFL